MKKSDINGDTQFEELLKSKMNELSDSVNCFDKISAKAFPDKQEDFSDSELTVSDLENITGKRKGIPALKFISIAAAFVLLAGIIPKLALVNSIRNNFMDKDKDCAFKNILSEINSETNDFDYLTFDVTLEHYVNNYVLVTPFYKCPFKITDDKDANVRIYIKKCGDMLTNQIYAVEYTGEYSDDNVIAAASNGVYFTESEIKELSEEYNIPEINTPDDTLYMIYSNANYSFSADVSGQLKDNDGNFINAAGFGDRTIFKGENGTHVLLYDVLYYNTNIDNKNSEFFYDTEIIELSAQSLSEYNMSENNWKYSVNCDDVSVLPKRDESCFTKVDIIPETQDADFSSANDIKYCIYHNIFPEAGEKLSESDINEISNEVISISASSGFSQTSQDITNVQDEDWIFLTSIRPPMIPSLKENLMIFYTPNESKTEKIESTIKSSPVYSEESLSSDVFGKSDIEAKLDSLRKISESDNVFDDKSAQYITNETELLKEFENKIEESERNGKQSNISDKHE
ncbi:MAG: hypothetical protein K6G20_05100 [Ruminococcus sp.]|nr:hypothetical protein [Ruminococcus sp.]